MQSILRLALAALVALTFTAQARAAGGLFELEWKELAPGVHVGQRPDPMRYPVVCNAVIVVGAESVLVFDGGGFPSQGQQVLAKVRALTPKPIKYLVISHWHGDHNRGLSPILAAFPKAEVISHEFTKAAILRGPAQRIFKDEKAGAARGTADTMRKALAQSKFLDGTALDPGERAFLERFIVDNQAHQAEIDRMELTIPTRTFTSELDLDLGARPVALRHFGEANTKGDAVMILADVGIVASGDMVVAPIPYGFGSYPKSWAAALRKVKTTNYRTLVPGHGALQSDAGYVDLLIETLESVAAQVDAKVAAGESLDDIRKAVDFSKVEGRFVGNDPVLKRFFGVFFKQPIVSAAYNVAKGIENEKLEDAK